MPLDGKNALWQAHEGEQQQHLRGTRASGRAHLTQALFQPPHSNVLFPDGITCKDARLTVKIKSRRTWFVRAVNSFSYASTSSCTRCHVFTAMYSSCSGGMASYFVAASFRYSLCELLRCSRLLGSSLDFSFGALAFSGSN